ncbi:MAG: enoyl-CoA hydratase/isomerase family protein [Candidatus Hydrogenedentes bacterium]|nr:enoyl-CoA hydratase/isomerase family protein [Candidatus Hydrogenedentota bacterium]
MSEPCILLDRSRPGILSLTLNRPDKRNALNVALLQKFTDQMRAANNDPALRAIVIRGAGPIFCAGLDLQEAREESLVHRSGELIAEMLRVVYFSPKVTIAAVRGAAIAGGAGLMSACDLAVATVDTRIGYPEVRIGLVAGLVMTFLRRQVPERQARELLLLGETISAERAQEIGLVSRAVPEDLLEDTVDMVVDCVLKGAPGAIAKSKEMLDSMWRPSVEEDLERTLSLHREMRKTPEALEGFAAFKEKRCPNWHPG